MIIADDATFTSYERTPISASHANVSGAPRRSVQGAFIPREGRAAVDWGARLGPEARRRLRPLERYLLALPA